MEASEAAPPPIDDDPKPKDDAPSAEETYVEPEDPKARAEAEAESRRTIAAVLRAVVITGVVLSIGAGVGFGLSMGVAAFVGAALAALNLVLFARLVQAFITQKGQSGPWAIVGMLKLVGLFACVFILVTRGGVSALGIALGFAALPIGITLGTLFKKQG